MFYFHMYYARSLWSGLVRLNQHGKITPKMANEVMSTMAGIETIDPIQYIDRLLKQKKVDDGHPQLPRRKPYDC